MTNWNKHYQENTVTAEEAITYIHSGDTVVFSHAAVEPTHIIRTLLAHADRYQNVEIIHMIGVGGLEYCRPEYKNHFHHNSFFASGGKTKQGISEGFIDVTPCCLSQVADILMNRLPKIDVFVGQMSPPDAHGYCSLGIEALTALRSALCRSTPICPASMAKPLCTLVRCNILSRAMTH